MKLDESIRIILEGERKKYRSIDDFMSFYSRQINSAFDMWMELPQIKSLYKLYNLGGDIKSKTFEYDYDSDDDTKPNSWIKKMKAAGYRYFDSSRGFEVEKAMLEIVVVKIPKI